MPEILIDISRLFYRRLKRRLPTGIDRVSVEYIRHFGEQAQAVLGFGPFNAVLSREDSRTAFEVLLDPDPGRQLPAAALITRAFFRWWVPCPLGGAFFLNTGHSRLEYPGYTSGIRLRGGRPVYFVHDLIPVTHPQYCRAGERDRHVKRIRRALDTGAGLIVPSRHTLETLSRFAEASGLRLPRTAVAPLATSLPDSERGPRPLAEPYFVVLGTIEPRKNHLMLLEVWRRLVKRLGESAPRLVIIGHRGWDNEAVFAMLDDGALGGFVQEHGSCDDATLVRWLKHAQALLFPSFVEGYGLPLAEALTLGVPAIAADLPVFREIAGDIPDYAGPADQARWHDLIVEYTSPAGARREAQLARMTGFRPTTWRQHFEIVDAFLESLAGVKQPQMNADER